ncbi:MAG: 50S ribosomal protein L10 [Candidatus Daviesbacteria bacterium]|nr:50S ribosomal protein L10 [Candidatus Daviesbacteria bacterium]
MAKTRVQKEVELKMMTDNLSRSKAVVFADYQQAGAAGTQQAGTSGSKGMTMKQLSDLRDILREQNAQLVITKNTLLKKATESLNLKIDDSVFDGPTATLFAYDDEISPIKSLVKALKEAALGKVKAGILGEDLLDEFSIIKLSTLPTKDELRGKTVGILAAPLQGMVGVLQANLRNLVYVVREIHSVYALSEIQKSKGGV